MSFETAAAQPTAVAAILGQLPVKLLYTKQDAAQFLSVSLRTIDNLIALKELKARRIGRRVLISLETLLQFVKRDHDTQAVN